MVKDIYHSFRALPLWVQIWVALILVPVNMAALKYIDQPYGVLVALLAIGGMTPNLFIMGYERGLSKAMSLPHLLIWTPLVVFLALWLRQGGPDSFAYPIYLSALLLVNLISLGFDYKDAWQWWHGARAVAGSAG